MSRPTLDDRLRTALARQAAGPLPPARAVTTVAANGARRRRRHQALRVVAGAVVLVLTIVAAVTLQRHTRPASPPDRLDRIMLHNGVVVPTYVPAGFAFEGANTLGPERLMTDASGRRLLLAADDDPDRQVVVALYPPGGPTVTPETLAHQRTVAIGTDTAMYTTTDGTYTYLLWSHDGRAIVMSGAKVALRDLVTVASSVTLELVPEATMQVTAPPTFHVVDDRAFVVDGPSTSLQWVGRGNRSIELRVTTSAPYQLTVPGVASGKTLDVLGHHAVAAQSDDHYATVSWVDGQGRVLEVTGYDTPLDDVVAVARSVEPLDASRWRSLRDSRPPDSFFDQLAPMAASTAPTAPATTVDPAAGPSYVDVGAAADVAAGGFVVADSTSDRFPKIAVVHLDGDRWLAVTRSGDALTCDVEPVTVGGHLEGWTTPCDPTTSFAPDGTCASPACPVGLTTFPVRVTSGRIEYAPDTWRAGDFGSRLRG